MARGLPLLAFALYAHLATQVFWLNAFGWERGGARLWFLAPVAPTEVLLAKNLAAYGVSAALLSRRGAALIAVGGPLPAWALAAAVALHLGIAPCFLAAGNLVSVLGPARPPRAPCSAAAAPAAVRARRDGHRLRRRRASFAVPALLAIRLETPWLLAAAWLALGAAGAVAPPRPAAPHGAAARRAARGAPRRGRRRRGLTAARRGRRYCENPSSR